MIILNTINNNFIISNSNLINLSVILLFCFPISIITGPFLPDLIITLLALIGLYLFIKKKIKIEFYKEIKFLWLFYFFAIISSLLSDKIIYSLDYTLFYFRFIIFSHFVIYLLINYPKLKSIFLKSILTSFSIMIIYSSIELILYLNMDEIDGIRRLHLFFSDEEVVGSFLVRLLPILCFFLMVNQDFMKSQIKKIFVISIILLSAFFIIYSGERTALLMLILLIFLYLLILIKLYRKLSFYFLIITTLFLSVNFFLSQNLVNRTIQDFDRNISLNPKVNPYLNYSLVSLEMFKDSPVIGKGPKMFRIYCPDEKYNNHLSVCNIHPHNIYLQLLGEMGIIGLFILLFAFLHVTFSFFKNLFSHNADKLYLFSLVGLMINFFPFIPSGNFFNNWINSLYYLSIIVIIYISNKTEKDF